MKDFFMYDIYYKEISSGKYEVIFIDAKDKKYYIKSYLENELTKFEAAIMPDDVFDALVIGLKEMGYKKGE